MTWPDRLRSSTLQSIIAPQNDVFFSAATLWELNLKVEKGKLVLPDDFMEALIAENFIELPVSWHHTIGIKHLPAIHTDPFDRLLLAQAHGEALTFVTADRLCLKYPVALMEA